jgi:hypothetical protein
MRRNSSVNIAAGWTARIQLPAGARYIYLPHSVLTGSGAYPASYAVGTGGYISRGIATGSDEH